MNTLRWTLGVIAILFIALPVIATLLLLGGIMFPFSKPLLHIAAVAAIGLLGFCFWQILREGAVPLWFAIAYLVAWFVYYWHAAWRAAPQP